MTAGQQEKAMEFMKKIEEDQAKVEEKNRQKEEQKKTARVPSVVDVTATEGEQNNEDGASIYEGEI
jgi:hypothetical protein